MDIDFDQRTATLGIGEFARFSLEPDGSGDGASTLERARLGTHWHRELRATTGTATPDASFEVPVTGRVFHGGWTLILAGRIDQLLPAAAASPSVIREIKTISSPPLPAPEEDLRGDYPGYFAQLATYLALHRIADPQAKIRGELVFVEAAGGLVQTVPFTAADEAPFRVQLERVAEFLNLRLRARERLRALRFRPAFVALRPGQETTQAELSAALAAHNRILFTAPTGFGKTGVLLECALGAMKSGRYSRLVYLTGKSTGQLQVVQTLQAMTAKLDASGPGLSTLDPQREATGVASWLIRPKREHCVNHVFHCVRDQCPYIRDLDRKWSGSGLARFYLFENTARDLASLRDAGRDALVCPYEITRAALPFQDVWIGDYNYVFSPASRGLFHDQPGWNPAETLLVIDEAHNLPSRAADACSHRLLADDARLILAELDHQRAAAPLLRAWEALTLFLAALPACDSLDLAQEDDLAHALTAVVDQLALHPPDHAAIGPALADQLRQLPAFAAWLADSSLPKLLWSPRLGELRGTCLDASAAIGETLAPFGGVIFSTATPGPVEAFATACGFAPPAESIRLIEKNSLLHTVAAHTPWRENAYDIAYDVRVDTTYRQRANHHATTAATIVALHEASTSATFDSMPPAPSSQLAALSSQLTATPCVAVFFPSYAYAEAIERVLQTNHPGFRAALQPRQADLAAQSAWVDESLALADALFLVLGSSFAEGIDLLGGRVGRAMVVGPALPEVNAVQQARLATLSHLGRDEAFRRVYQIPGMQKVNQALGRLVRAPGQRAKVLLHCRRFAELSYAKLLDRDYQFGTNLTTGAELNNWLCSDPSIKDSDLRGGGEAP